MAAKQLRSRADAATRAQRAWTARVVGATWDEAADVAGFAHASSTVRAVRAYFGRLPVLDADERRELWRERLEVLWRASVKDVRQQRPGAVRAAVAVAQRAAALDGLDAPTEVRATITPSFEEVHAWVVAASGRQIDGPPLAIEAEIID